MHPIPDTGSLAGDLEVLLCTFREQLRHRLVGRILADLHAEMNRSPQLAKRVRERVQKERRERGETILRRAIARGEIPAATDLELVKDAIGALIYWRLVVLGETADDQYVGRVLHAVLLIASQCKIGDRHQASGIGHWASGEPQIEPCTGVALAPGPWLLAHCGSPLHERIGDRALDAWTNKTLLILMSGGCSATVVKSQSKEDSQ
jgi:Tetracyclin repressor-like, C-terminal domain